MMLFIVKLNHRVFGRLWNTIYIVIKSLILALNKVQYLNCVASPFTQLVLGEDIPNPDTRHQFVHHSPIFGVNEFYKLHCVIHLCAQVRLLSKPLSDCLKCSMYFLQGIINKRIPFRHIKVTSSYHTVYGIHDQSAQIYQPDYYCNSTLYFGVHFYASPTCPLSTVPLG